MPRLYNLSSHKFIRKKLRHAATTAERRLWQFVKNDQFHGFRFRRQFSIGRYIVDFYCPKLHLAIELDGNVHRLPETRVYDEERQRFLESFSIRIVRFTNNDVEKNIDAVLKKLAQEITSLSATPCPPSEFRRGT